MRMVWWTGIVLFWLGVVIGWFLRRASMDDRIGRMDLTMQAAAERICASAPKDAALMQSAEAQNDLDLLLCLEAGGVSEAKGALIYKLGLFYHRWTSEPAAESEAECIEKTLFRIREAAKQCKPLHDALSQTPKNEIPAA